MAEHLTVAQVVVGSSPIIRPERTSLVRGPFLYRMSKSHNMSF